MRRGMRRLLWHIIGCPLSRRGFMASRETAKSFRRFPLGCASHPDDRGRSSHWQISAEIPKSPAPSRASPPTGSTSPSVELRSIDCNCSSVSFIAVTSTTKRPFIASLLMETQVIGNASPQLATPNLPQLAPHFYARLTAQGWRRSRPQVRRPLRRRRRRRAVLTGQPDSPALPTSFGQVALRARRAISA